MDIISFYWTEYENIIDSDDSHTTTTIIKLTSSGGLFSSTNSPKTQTLY